MYYLILTIISGTIWQFFAKVSQATKAISHGLKQNSFLVKMQKIVTCVRLIIVSFVLLCTDWLLQVPSVYEVNELSVYWAYYDHESTMVQGDFEWYEISFHLDLMVRLRVLQKYALE